MANILILNPTAVSAIAVSRGTGGANLTSFDPKEVWTDAAVGSAATIDLDLGAVKSIDTIALVAIYGPVAGATWTITGGPAGYADAVIKASSALRAIDAAGQVPSVSHALWTGAAVNVRYLRISVTQPAGNPALSIGRAICGAGFVPVWNKEWGAGRGVIDTGISTRLPSGGFAIVAGAKLGTYKWTFGDLSEAEYEALYALQSDAGETGPVLVVEDPAATTAQRNRIHYGLLRSLRPFERRNPRQTRWELNMEEWV